MFRNLANQFSLTFTVRADGPVLIRSGNETGLDPTRPDMEFVRTGGEAYLPGSSLKGVFRSWCERLLRTEDPSLACVPTDGRKACVSVDPRTGMERRPNLEKVSGGEARYRASCRACQMFGNTALRARVEFQDAMALSGTVRTSQRNHVAINRVTGGAQGGALFSPEVLEAGEFRCHIRLTNYALWQVSLLLQAMADMDAGYLTIGGGTAKGYGRMRLVADVADSSNVMHAEWRDYRSGAPSGWQGYGAPDRVPLDLSWRKELGWVAALESADTWDRLNAILPAWQKLLAADKTGA